MLSSRFYSKMTHFLPDFPPGPLEFYRKKASFDWRKLKVHLYTEEVIKYENELHEVLRKHPEYQSELLSPSFDDERRQANRRAFAHKSTELLSLPVQLENLKRVSIASRAMMQLSPGSAIKYQVSNQLFMNVIRSLGTSRHADYLNLVENGEIFGCFCLTEIGHGTNTKGMRTTATYDKEKKQFVMHSPDFEAAKCWAGGLGQGATHAVVFAQLVIDNTSYGLHTFVIPVRDPTTLLPYPGVIVGDMGEKIGLNGIDNGFLIFDKYHIPRENLLNKTADVTEDGKYVTPYRDPNSRHGASLGSLSMGRISITGMCESYGSKALTIAIRYAAVRKQFGPNNVEEVPVLEYQIHQYRLLPYLAASYVIRIFSSYLTEVGWQFSIDSMLGQNKEILPDLGMEIHAVSSASKPVSGWTFRDAIQECREACGGHGYLKAAGIGDIRNDHDANCTYEGENHVLIQQTANWLLKFWPMIERGEKISTPLQSANFLTDAPSILKHVFKANNLEEVCETENVIDAFQWLTCYFLRETKNKLNTLSKEDQFWAKNNVQVFYAKNLGTAFIQHLFLQRMLLVIKEAEDLHIKKVLTKLFSLYGLWTLEKRYLATLYQGGYAEGSKPTFLIQEGILKLCGDIKNDAVSLVDVIAPPDFILNSVLGAADGEVYKRLQLAMFSNPYAMSRPTWWQDIVNWKANIKSKI